MIEIRVCSAREAEAMRTGHWRLSWYTDDDRLIVRTKRMRVIADYLMSRGDLGT